MKKIIFVFLSLIVLVALALRVWQIGRVPISPDWDEVSLGYNAYSIMQTGKDEYGEFLPVVLRSFDDYKPSLYAYLSIPLVWLFGLNVEAIRLPSAIFGILTVLATFFLARELFKRNDIALLSSFLLAISPMSIQFSRIAFESNVGVALNVFAALFFTLGLKRPFSLLIAALFAGLNIYMYQGEKVFTPLLFLVLVVIFRKELFLKPLKYIVASVLIGVLLVLPMLGFILTNKNALGRARGVSIIAEPFPHSLAQRVLDDKKRGDILGLIFDNRRVVYAKSIISGYLSHFDANWLFVRGDIARHHAPNMGLLYFFELPLLFIGIYSLLFGKFGKKTKFLIFSWFLLAPVSASITSGVPHAVRTLNFLPTFQIFIAIGILSAFSSISNIKYQILKIQIKYFIFSFFFLFFIFNFIYYLNQYFVQQNYFNAKEWQYGYAKIVPALQLQNYKKIIVSNQPPMDQSYMFFLFYLKYDSSLYQEQAKYASGGFKENHTFGKFEFRPIQWDKEKRNSSTIFIGRPNDFSEDAKVINTIFYPNGEKGMLMVQ